MLVCVCVCVCVCVLTFLLGLCFRSELGVGDKHPQPKSIFDFEPGRSNTSGNRDQVSLLVFFCIVYVCVGILIS